MQLASVALAATLACGPVHPMIVAPHNNAHITIRDTGVQPLCPNREDGWVAWFHVRGTHFNFRAVCDRDGRVSVWDAR